MKHNVLLTSVATPTKYLKLNSDAANLCGFQIQSIYLFLKSVHFIDP